MRALTETQFDTILERMRAQVSSWHAADDRRAIFLDCYSRMTANMLGAFGAGKFLDDAWVRMLLRVFAGHYFSALEDWERQRSGAPPAWGIAFEAARSPATWITRDLLLGVNAHINYDLALAVRELLQDDWADMDESARLCRFIDFSNVNAVIGATIDEVQDEVLGPFNRLLVVADKALGPLDEWLISRLVSHWRDRVWRHAVQLLEAPDPESFEQVRAQVESSALALAQAILGHSGPLSALKLV
ncbi:MAG: DUF5995 family protein [Thermoflexales bacterium]